MKKLKHHLRKIDVIEGQLTPEFSFLFSKAKVRLK